MHPGILDVFQQDDFLFLAAIAIVSAGTSFAVFMACFYWFRREQRRILSAVTYSEGEVSVAGRSLRPGELVAQFKAKQGRQVISVLEADGKRFLHIDGEISAPERAKMVRYLKSEGFMS
jgi:hypothetical protein